MTKCMNPHKYVILKWSGAPHDSTLDTKLRKFFDCFESLEPTPLV